MTPPPIRSSMRFRIPFLLRWHFVCTGGPGHRRTRAPCATLFSHVRSPSHKKESPLRRDLVAIAAAGLCLAAGLSPAAAIAQTGRYERPEFDEGGALRLQV